MMKRLFLCLLLSTSLFSQSTRVPNLCESAFLKSYSSYFVKTKLVKASPVNFIKGLLQIDDVSIRISKLEREYNLLSREYIDKITQIEKEFKALGESSGLDFSAVQAMMEAPKQQAYIDTLEHLNTITAVAHNSLVAEGMQVALKSRKVAGTSVMANYLEIIDLPSKKYFNSIATINRYKQRFGTKTVTFDFAQNMKNGSAGFSQASTKRIDLGFRGMRNIVLDDLITMVGKHEFKHASFAAKRVKGRESIYHAQYISTTETKISSVPNHYNRYMSSEELYNFTNNPYWASNRIGDIRSYKKIDYLNDINGIYYYIQETEKIAGQTKEITQRTITYLNSLLKEPKRFASEMLFLTPERTFAKTVDEAFFIQFKMPDGIVYMDWANINQFKDEISLVLNNRVKLDSKYRSSFEAAGADEKLKIYAKYAKEELELNAASNKEIVKMLVHKQETLNRVATNIIPLNREVIKKTEDFMGFYMMRKRLEPGYLQTTQAQESFLELRQMYRDLGNYVKEDFKGFVGR